MNIIYEYYEYSYMNINIYIYNPYFQINENK